MAKYDGCRGKMRHKSQRYAMAELFRSDNASLEAYKCKLCHGWHLGNSRKAHNLIARVEHLLEERCSVSRTPK